MPGISRVGIDTAVGTIVGNLAPKVIVEGVPIVVKGASVEPHAPCPIPPHCDAVMDAHSQKVKANGIFICREGDAATCGHTATGSGKVFAG